MFTGIIETLGTIDAVERDGTNTHFWISSDFSNELKIDQSVAHDGVCLTVVELDSNRHRVTAIDETLSRTTLSDWDNGRTVNLERCMPANGRFDGHIVQGHVDMQATVVAIDDVNGSWNFQFEFSPNDAGMVVEKGSVTVNGVSLTVVEASEASFSVSIIPYTYEHTSFHQLSIGDSVNIEFDILGKYVMEAQRRLRAR